MSSFTVAVASDIHAFDSARPSGSGGDADPSYLSTSTPDASPTQNPILQLTELIGERGLTADILLCPGDIGDKASPAGIRRGWQALNEIADALKCGFFSATVGNHDMDSRGTFNNHDPRGFLQTLLPPFPSPDATFNQHYWARNFAVYSNGPLRLVVLNSAAFHGFKDEHTHGRVSQYCLDELGVALAAAPPPPINILLCHHHPHRHSDVPFTEEYDAIEGGSQLLNLLDSGKFGSWIVVHGHKHFPKVCYAAGSADPPIVFSAGSLCAKLTGKLSTLARNQFYLLDFDLAQIARLGVVGTFRSWDWNFGMGWTPSPDSSQLPSRGGFGCRHTPRELANRIAALFTAHVPAPILSWEDVIKQIEVLAYVLPSGIESIVALLPTLGLEVVRDGSVIHQVGTGAA